MDAEASRTYRMGGASWVCLLVFPAFGLTAACNGPPGVAFVSCAVVLALAWWPSRRLAVKSDGLVVSWWGLTRRLPFADDLKLVHERTFAKVIVTRRMLTVPSYAPDYAPALEAIGAAFTAWQAKRCGTPIDRDASHPFRDVAIDAVATLLNPACSVYERLDAAGRLDRAQLSDDVRSEIRRTASDTVHRRLARACARLGRGEPPSAPS